ncbi:NINE protein [Bifidobacterium sp. ESL0769]|uniref:NINE protein n=1 Tax=Bifidobacterium sp. ESL0769 TaxID=2983229 RepID=UPI0023F8B935|nr:NINE protein [Bifidobacterium sp. ESL0769]WEV67755.1 NINE protein [Bifidobacterium sp. ESL0769]
MNDTPDPQVGQPGGQTPQGSNIPQGQYGSSYGQYQGQQYSQPGYAQGGAAQTNPQPNYGQAAYGQPQQPQYGQPDYGQSGYTQASYGYASGSYSQPYAANQSYPQGQPYAAQYGQPQPLPYGYQPKSKMAAGLLGIFLGWLGVHNFYLGHYGKAAGQLALTLVGWILFGLGPVAAFIWGLIEGVLILSSNYGSPWHRDARGVELRE